MVMALCMAMAHVTRPVWVGPLPFVGECHLWGMPFVGDAHTYAGIRRFIRLATIADAGRVSFVVCKHAHTLPMIRLNCLLVVYCYTQVAAPSKAAT
jgi:hypothetical protein